jgi:hypothetical protein
LQAKGRPFRAALFLCAGKVIVTGRMRIALAFALLCLAACGKEERPPAPSAEQSDRLDEAEAMLNDVATNEEGPVDRSAGPSNSSDPAD